MPLPFQQRGGRCACGDQFHRTRRGSGRPLGKFFLLLRSRGRLFCRLRPCGHRPSDLRNDLNTLKCARAFLALGLLVGKTAMRGRQLQRIFRAMPHRAQNHIACAAPEQHFALRHIARRQHRRALVAQQRQQDRQVRAGLIRGKAGAHEPAFHHDFAGLHVNPANCAPGQFFPALCRDAQRIVQIADIQHAVQARFARQTGSISHALPLVSCLHRLPVHRIAELERRGGRRARPLQAALLHAQHPVCLIDLPLTDQGLFPAGRQLPCVRRFRCAHHHLPHGVGGQMQVFRKRILGGFVAPERAAGQRHAAFVCFVLAAALQAVFLLERPAGLRQQSQRTVLRCVAAQLSDPVEQVGGKRLLAAHNRTVDLLEQDLNGRALIFVEGSVLPQLAAAHAQMCQRTLDRPGCRMRIGRICLPGVFRFNPIRQALH